MSDEVRLGQKDHTMLESVRRQLSQIYQWGQKGPNEVKWSQFISEEVGGVQMTPDYIVVESENVRRCADGLGTNLPVQPVLC